MINPAIFIHPPQHKSNAVFYITEKIVQEIQAGNLHISTRKKHIDPHPNSPSFFDLHQTLSNKSKSASKYQRSSFSLQDRKLVRLLKQKMQDFEQFLKEKQKIMKKQKLQKIKQQLNKQILIRKKQSIKHVQQVLSRRHKKQLIKRQEQEKNKSLKALKRLQSRSRIYIINQEQQQQRMLEEEKQRERLLTEMSEQKRSLVNISRLKQYQSGYLNQLKHQKKQRKNKLLRFRQSEKAFQKISDQKSNKSKYYLMIQKQIQKDRHLAEEQARKKIQNKGRIKEFLQKIKNIGFPVKKESKQTQSPPASVKIERSYTQQRQIGNRFMKESFNLINRNKQINYLTKESTSIGQSSSQEKHNYLKQMKERRLKTKSQTKNTLFSLNKTTINKIMSSKENSNQRIEKIKKLAYQLQADYTNGDPYKQIQKIKTKIFILQSALNKDMI